MSAIAEFLSRPLLRSDVFIETGSKNGDTIEVALGKFKRCHSIEIDSIAFAKCQERFKDEPSVTIHRGDSREVLPRIIDPNLATTFYLDAHFEGGPSAPRAMDTECPLLGELRIITAQPWRVPPVIVIDDIGMFKEGYWYDPHSNHLLFSPEDWPRLQDINALLRGWFALEDPTNQIGVWF